MEKLLKLSCFKRMISIIERKYFKILRLYLTFLHNRKISKERLILNIKKYFSKNLNCIDYKIITPSDIISFNNNEIEFLKENILCSKEIKKNMLNRVIQREIFISKFQNVKLFGISGGIMYKNKILVESFSNLGRLKVSVCANSILLKKRHLKGVYSSIIHLKWAKKNIFHWIIECLPRLYSLINLNESTITLIVHKEITKLQLETLKALLDNRFKILKIGVNEVWELENFYFPSFCNEDCSGYMPVLFLNNIREKIIEYFKIKPRVNKIRLYVSRQKTGYRCLSNEEQFYNLLKKYDFKRIFAEELTFKEQVELFSSASIVISIHGAGLTNIVFSKNLKIIEIFPPNVIKTHYFMLSKALGFEYNYILGLAQNSNNSGFLIDQLEIEMLIKNIL